MVKAMQFISFIYSQLCLLRFKLFHRNELRDKETLYIPIWPSFGDMTFTLGYLSRVKEKRNKKICVICDQRRKDFAELYNSQFDSAKYICFDQLIKYFDKWIMEYLLDLNYIIIYPGGYFSNGFMFIKKQPTFNLPDFIKLSLLGLNKNDEYFPPDISSVTVPDDYELEYSVILSPYANSTPLLPEKFWIQIVPELKKMGYPVYSNVQKSEVEIPGTLRLECTVPQLMKMLKSGGIFIGLRNGVMDALLFTECMIISILSVKEDLHLFDLNAFIPKENVYQFTYQNDIKTLTQDVLNCLRGSNGF